MGAPFFSLKCCYVCKNERGRISGGSPTNLSVEYSLGFLLYFHLSLSAIFNFTTKFDIPWFPPHRKKNTPANCSWCQSDSFFLTEFLYLQKIFHLYPIHFAHKTNLWNSNDSYRILVSAWNSRVYKTCLQAMVVKDCCFLLIWKPIL